MLHELNQGSAHSLPSIPDKSIHCIVTSPPYYSLRKYDGDQTVGWPSVTYAPMTGIDCTVTIPAMSCDLGQEPTLEAYIGHLILCLREWWRVLRDDGTCWVNLGDSYNGSGGSGGDYNAGGLREGEPKTKGSKSPGLKAKDLCMVPQRLALAAQADGWWVRAEVIWSKKSPMPESVTDRPTRAHEQIYLLTKSARYYYDHVAVRQPIKQSSLDRLGRGVGDEHKLVNGAPGQTPNTLHQPRYNVKFGGNKADGYGTNLASGNDWTPNNGANLRDVWTLSSKPFRGSHYAVFPEDIPETAIKAGTSARGCCPACGAQWVRVIERSGGTWEDRKKSGAPMRVGMGNKPYPAVGQSAIDSIGWSSGCDCPEAEPTPATILDPFMGSGTTCMVATRLSRRSIGVDISEEYLEKLAPERISNVQMEMSF